jgi:quinoprotein dehydrogenase-associated probable ABC transporter substrate-binding protein
MSSDIKSRAAKTLFAILLCGAIGSPLLGATSELRVCADPNNLPYSNQQQQGFENALATLVANDLGMNVSYFWYPQRHKFFHNTLQSGACDVVMEVPAGIDVVSTTVPYYRSTYVFVSRQNLHIESFDDPRLRDLRIGVHLTGDGDEQIPSTEALLKRGLAQNIVGYSIFGNLSEQNPSSDIVRAVADNNIDVAVVWGPLGGYFAEHSSAQLEATPVCAAAADQHIPLAFDIAMGVRKGNEELRDKLNAVIVRRRADIRKLLESYAVPLVESQQLKCE